MGELEDAGTFQSLDPSRNACYVRPGELRRSLIAALRRSLVLAVQRDRERHHGNDGDEDASL